MSKLVRDFEKFATVRSRYFKQSESVIEEVDSSQPAAAAAAATVNSLTTPKNIFVKNRRKAGAGATVPKNLHFSKQISVGEGATYRRQRRQAIHVEIQNSTEA